MLVVVVVVVVRLAAAVVVVRTRAFEIPASCALASRNSCTLCVILVVVVLAVIVALAVKRPSLDGSGARLSAQVLIGCVESSEVFCRKLIVVARL